MPVLLSEVENIVQSFPGLRKLSDEVYELSFENPKGRQIAVNRKSVVKAVGVWIENSLDPHTLGLSTTARIVHYPSSKPRAHLTASRLTGPYKSRSGNDCWYVAMQDESDVRRLVAAYLS